MQEVDLHVIEASNGFKTIDTNYSCWHSYIIPILMQTVPILSKVKYPTLPLKVIFLISIR